MNRLDFGFGDHCSRRRWTLNSECLEADPEYSRVFDEVMISFSRIETGAVLEALDDEHVVPGSDPPHFAKLFDVHMMVATTGRERTVEEYGELFERAGMRLAGHHTAAGHPMSVVEGRVI